MNKLSFYILILLFLGIVQNINSQTVFFSEDFELGTEPEGWTYDYIVDWYDWEFSDGGYSTTPAIPGSGYPSYAYQGFYNAMFHVENLGNETTRFITPPIDLSYGIKPELSFFHAQNDRQTFGEFRNDELRVYIRKGENTPWVKILEYTERVEDWVERNIFIADSLLSDSVFVAFEGKTNNGYGVCIDSVTIIERGIIPRYLESINIIQASTDKVPTGSYNNAILRIDISVKGNDGDLVLDSLAVKSLNTNDSDIEPNGVKLYVSNDTIFQNSIRLGTATNFQGGVASFTNLNKNLITGLSSIWVTYDIIEDTNHELHENILDAKIEMESIRINGYNYPSIDKSPTGERIIFEALLLDNFESDLGWILEGEFQRDTSKGLGGSIGNADPINATSGGNVLGTDLTGLGTNLGDYELELSDKEYKATSTYINCKYYKDVYLYFNRWLNVDGNDTVTIDIATETKDNWQTYWQNKGTLITNQWTPITYNISSFVSRKDSVQIRYTLGPTNDFWNFSGWNIDDIIIVGNYISKDVSITEWIDPIDGCGHSENELVTIKIKNLAGEPMEEPLPVSYSFDEGETIYYDTIYSIIPVGDSLMYTIDKPIDLTNPGWYYNVYASTHLPGDEDITNDKFELDIFIAPTYNLPYYQNFETSSGYYNSGGVNSSWEYGTPAVSNPIINTASSGSNIWATNLSGNYLNNDSSFLESPCFNFNGIDSIILEFKCIGISEDKTDGLTVLYSSDQGITWDFIPDNNDFYWSWYTEPIISELGYPGIDDTNGGWLTFRQLLPPILSNENSVKFRFMFESNDGSVAEGFGIDDIKLYEAPYDVGMRSLIYPYNKCEWSDTTHVKVYVENYGIRDVLAGTKIPLSLNFESEIIKDTLTLESDLAVADSILFTFNSTVDMSFAGDFNFIINTKLESDTYFYNDTLSNDTLSTTVSVTGMPNYNPFQDQIGDNPIDTFLVAGIGFSNYNWSGGGTPDNTLPTDTLYINTEGTYKVTVTNAVGCTATDSVEIVNSDIDLAMDSLYTVLEDSCQRNALTELSVHYINNSFNPLEINDTILLGYQINSNAVVKDTMFLTEEIAVDDTAWFTYNKKADLTTPGRYTIKVFTNFLRDLNHADDTIKKTVNTNGYVDIELNYDTIYTSQADTLEIIASPEYANYIWNPAGSNDTISPSNNTSQWYKVTVSDTFACGEDYDSTYIETYDLGISAINYPTDTCENEVLAPSIINVDITNYSENTYASTETVSIYYNYDNAGWNNVTPQLGSNLLANDTISLDIDNIDISTPGSHTIKIYTSSDIDANHTNDTIEYSFNTWQFPYVELAYDSIFTTEPDTIVLYPTLGFDTYNWSDASNNDTLIVTNSGTFNYVVTVTDENGCGSDKDSTHVITYNLGVSSIISPLNACSHTTEETVRINVKNFGNDIIPSGQTIDVGYVFNGGFPVMEVFTLESDLSPSKTASYDFTTKIDMTGIETYTLKTFTAFELDVYLDNDTIYDAIKTYGYPTVEIGPDIYTAQYDTVKIIANPGYNFYKWNDGTINDTLELTKPQSFEYIVTVTNINGCSTMDSASVYTTNVRASALISPFTTCEFTGTETVTVEVENNCSDTISSGETIAVSYKIGSGSLITENIVLTTDLLPNETLEHSFSSTVNLTSLDNYTFKIFAEYNIDVNINDTMSVNIYEVGYPVFSLGDDIYTTNPDGITLSAPGEYDSYLWQDGSTSDDFAVTYLASAQYSVTVADEYGCEGSDTIEVYTYNIAADSIAAPIAQCDFTRSEIISIGVTNNSKDTLQAGEGLEVGYRLNSGSYISEAFTLTGILYPDSTELFSLSSNPADLTSNQLHEFKVFAKLTDIDVYLEDTALISIDNLKPNFDLGEDITTGDNQYTIDVGEDYSSYLWFDDSDERTYLIDINDQNPNNYYAVTVTNTYGCSADDSIQVTFTTTPDLEVTAMLTPISGCWNATETYPVHIEITNSGMVNLNPGDNFIVGYNIDGGAEVTETFNLTTAMNASDTREYTFPTEISFASADIYLFKPFVKHVEDGNASNDTLTTGTIVEITAPEVILGASDTVSTTGTSYEIQPSESYITYLWSDANNSTSPTITVTESGLYSVTITDGYGCSGEGSIYVKFLTTGIDNLIQGNGYKITYFPNPVSEQLMVHFENKKPKDIIIEIVSSNGQLVYNNKISDVENSFEEIDVTPFSNGVYYVKFNIDNEFYIRKIIIQ